MTFAQRRNRLTTHFSESILVVKGRISVFAPKSYFFFNGKNIEKYTTKIVRIHTKT